MKRIIRSKDHLIQVNRRSAQRTIGIAAFLIACIGFATPILVSRADNGNIQLSCGPSSAIADTSGNYVLRQNFTNIGTNTLYPYNQAVNGTYMDAYYTITPLPAGAYVDKHFFAGIVTNPSTYNILPGQVTYASTTAVTGLAAGTTYSLKATFQDVNFVPVLNCTSSVTKPAAATPAPTPVPITPPTTPRPATPRPATPRPATSVVAQPTVTLPVPAGDTQPPSTPSDFIATSDPTNALVDLTWSASTDNTAVTGYSLERSADKVTWETLALNGLGTSYNDESPKFGLHYYYRLQASDGSGNKSAYATTDALVAGFKSIADDVDMVYSSTDSLAKVLVPSGTFAEPVTCSLEAIAGMDGKGTLKHPVIVAGAYQLSCKNQNSDDVAPSLHPLTWTLSLKGKLKGLSKPAVVAFDSSDRATEVKEPFAVSKDNVITFKTTSVTRVAGAAARVSYAWLQYVAVAVLIMLGVAVTAALVLHRSRKMNYEAYIRSKYYDL